MLLGLLKTLFFIIAFYYIFKFLTKLFAPILMNKMADNIKKRAAAQYGNNNQQQPNVKEGETVIDKAPSHKNKTNNSVGEYVDYEEID